MSLLTIIQNAARALNISVPTTVVGNTDLNTALLLRLAQEEGKELARRHDWQKITKEKTFTTTAAAVQASSIASDFDRFVFGVEIWNRTLSQKYRGPISSQAWQRLQVGQAGGIVGWWRLRGGDLLIYPSPTAGQTAAYEYVSNQWCESSGGTDQSAWAADTDTGILSEDLMTLGIIWRWKQTKGLAYAEEMATYERELEKAAGRDRGPGVIQTSTGRDEDWPPAPIFDGTIDA